MHAAEGAQRVGLASRAVQREHQLAPEPLAVGVLGHQRVELSRDLVVATQREQCLDPFLDRGDAQLFEPGCFGASEIVGRELGEGRAAPERQRVVERVERGAGVAELGAALRLRDELLEVCRVIALGVDREDIPGQRVSPGRPRRPSSDPVSP